MLQVLKHTTDPEPEPEPEPATGNVFKLIYCMNIFLHHTYLCTGTHIYYLPLYLLSMLE